MIRGGLRFCRRDCWGRRLFRNLGWNDFVVKGLFKVLSGFIYGVCLNTFG